MNKKRKSALVLLNDSAGTGKAGTNTLKIARRLAENGFEPIIYPIIPGTDLVSEKILKEYEGKVDVILCSGGDGTLNHVMQGIVNMDSKPCLAYIPAGSTNDFAKGLGIPVEFNRALDTALNGNIFRYDVGKLNDKFFNYVAAFGAFSAISYTTDQQLKNVLGHAAYIVSAVSDLHQNIHYSCHMKIETEDIFIEDDFIFGAICNSVSLGGFKMFKDADIKLNDGKMELLLIKAPKTPPELQGILSALRKGNFDHPNISFRQISSVSLFSDSDTAWALDGEFGGAHEVVKISIIKQAVPIMTGESQVDQM